MTSPHFFKFLPAFLAVFAIAGPLSETASASEIEVTLFGQKCMLAGPLPQETLKAIHAISPEQIYPEDPTAETLRAALDKLKKGGRIPSNLDVYRSRLRARLQAQLSFHTGLAASRKSSKSQPLLEATREFTEGRRAKEFETLARKIDAAKKIDSDLATQLQDLYFELLPPDPEDDFHRTIRAMKINYTCVFADENEADVEQ